MQKFVNYRQKSFVTTVPGVNIIKLFWNKFTHTLCKLDNFINIHIICFIAMKRVSKLLPKKFYEIDPRIERLGRDKQSSFLDPFARYKENEVL